MGRPPAKTPQNEDQPRTCGVIMPISATANHTADHWRSVQTLLHRAIESAGLKPHNVWDGAATDRITSRILANLFADPIAVCDISELNPNVMLELGMRLSSKKPTVVVREEGAKIPFDIGDFSTLTYPRDLSILPMEDFIEELVNDINEKLLAFDNNSYRSFLEGIEIEFLEPTARAVPFEALVSSQLDGISHRLAAIEKLRSSTGEGPVLSGQSGEIEQSINKFRRLIIRTRRKMTNDERRDLENMNVSRSFTERDGHISFLVPDINFSEKRDNILKYLEGIGIRIRDANL